MYLSQIDCDNFFILLSIFKFKIVILLTAIWTFISNENSNYFYTEG